MFDIGQIFEPREYLEEHVGPLPRFSGRLGRGISKAKG